MKKSNVGKVVAASMAFAMLLTAGVVVGTQNSANASNPATSQESTLRVNASKQKLKVSNCRVDLKTNTEMEWQEGGLTPKPEVRFGMHGELLKENVDYELEYKNNYEVGTATVIVKGIGNYKGKVKEQFLIVGTDIDTHQVYDTAKVENGKVTLYYDDEVIDENDYDLDIKFKKKKLINQEEVDGKTVKTYRISYRVTIEGKNQYYGVINTTLFEEVTETE
mgnify:CR=1 FL=1